MENASKALIMAGSLLIALIIIGALLLMFNNLSSYQDSTDKNEKEAQIVEFNNQYETYNRTDVRGSDLYSLLNRVVDYNRRKSEVQLNNSDEGVDLKFQPMTIIVKFGSAEQMKNLTYDNEIRLFNKILDSNNSFEVKESNSNTFETKISGALGNIENTYGGKTGISNLASGISNLFLKNNNNPTEVEKKRAEDLYKKSTGSYESFTNLQNAMNNKTKTYTDICTYYEYIQFKRAHFDCIDTDYNDKKTGRIVSLTFEFNGKTE